MQIAAGLTGRAQSDDRISIVARPIHRRMTSDERLFYVHIGIATDSGASAQDQQSTGSWPYWELELVPGRHQNGSGWSLLAGG